MVLKLVKTFLSVALAGERCVGETKVIVLWLVSWDETLVPWDMEVLVCNWCTLKQYS